MSRYMSLALFNALAVKLAWVGKIDHLQERGGTAGDEGD